MRSRDQPHNQIAMGSRWDPDGGGFAAFLTSPRDRTTTHRLASVFEERKESAVSTRGVYDEYKCFCERKAIEVMCPSAFGKLFKKVFPNISVRRLGPRGENFNHYYNLGRKASPNSGHPAACDDGMASFPRT